MAQSKTPKDLSASILAGSEEMFDFHCVPCSTERHVEAVGYCQQCSEYLCITCINYHGKLSATKHHKVLDKTTMPKTKEQPKIETNDTLEERCRKHPDEVLKYFCKIHNQICCSVCLTLEHVSCSDKSYIPEISDCIAKSQEYKNLTATLNRLVWELTERQGHINDDSKKNENMYSKALSDIELCRKQINNILDKIEDDTKRKFSKFHQENANVIREDSEKCQLQLSDLMRIASNMEETAKAGKNNNLFVHLKLSCNRIAEIERQMAEVYTYKMKRYSFHQDESIQQMKSTLSDIWSLSVKQLEVPVEAKYFQKCNMKSVEDTEECNISGIAVLAKQCIVATDIDNKAVKLIDMKMNKLLARLSVCSQPFDITVIKPHQVAVALGNKYQIEIISVSEVLSRSHTIDTPGASIAGLCYNGSNFIAACPLTGSIKVIDMSGRTLSSINNDDQGTRLFSEPRYIAVSRYADVVYVTDRNSNKVTSLTLSGGIISVYSHDKLERPAGITVGNDGAVYVCSRRANTIHQLTPAGNLTQVLLGVDQKLAKRPNAIAYGDKDNILYISSADKKHGECNYCRLYQLE